MHFLASVFTGFALTASSFFPFFHNGPGTSTPPHPPFQGPSPTGSSTQPVGGPVPNGPGGGWGMGSSTVSGATIACVGAAVATREASIDAAEGTLTSTLTSAYSTRASDLASAYALSSTSAVSAAVKAAWQSFSSSNKSAEDAWKSAQTTAWQGFMTTAKACKAPPSVLDMNEDRPQTPGQ
jgi:hypothetical protein